MTSAEHAAGRREHLYGAMLAVLGGATLSIGGPLVRLLEQADGWTVLFYRGLSFFVVLLAIVVWQSRGGALARYLYMGWIGFGIAVCLGVGFIAYLTAMFHTTVANVVFVVGASPLITALLAWIVLRERLSALSWTVLALALVGIAVMVGEGLTEGRLLGSVIAFGAAVTFSMLVIMLRSSRETDMLAATSLAGLVSAVMCLFVVESLAVTTHDLVISLTLGAVQIGLGFTFITYASRYIPAAEVTLLALVETILAPIWTWLVAGEVPGLATLGGGAMVLVCVGLFALMSLRQEDARDNA